MAAARVKPAKRIVTEAQQAFSFTRRSVFVGGVQMALGGVLAARLAYLSIFENEKYSLLAESNRVNLTLIPPRRGWIVDRKGYPIALNRTAFRVDLIPDRLKEPDKTLAELQRLLGLSSDEIERITKDLDKAAGFQPVQVADNLDWERYAAISIRATEMPGVAPAQSFARFYPEGASVGHLVGYVGVASAKQYEETRDPILITPGFKVGKDGLEKTLEPRLRGQPGAKRTEVTARGKLVRDLETRDDVAGQTIKLTIDAGIQAYAARRLGLESGSAVVIDTVTGGIVAMASMPCYDPNDFSDGIGTREWSTLREDEYLPLLNKSLQGLYPPGSTVKPMAALAFLRHGVDPDETVFCGGGYRLGNRTFRCLGRHGSVSMRTAIARSCNTYFYAMGNRIGYDKIAVVARELGLGEEFTLPVASQRYGTVPDTAWKKRKLDQDWSRADTLNATIGQGYVSVSPLQLAVMSARIASGLDLNPTLIAGSGKSAPPLAFPPEHLIPVREGMAMVVAGGTGARSQLQLDGIKMAGKTGTAQVRKIEGSQRGQSGTWKYRDHGLFVFYAPTDNPRYAGAVVIEHGLGGARAAAPVAKDILTYIYDPAKAMAALTALESGWGGDVKARSAARRERLRAEAGTSGAASPASNAPPPSSPGNASAPVTGGNAQPAASVSAASPAPAQTTTDNGSDRFEDEP
jgi:penicillin-binding protein 2